MAWEHPCSEAPPPWRGKRMKVEHFMKTGGGTARWVSSTEGLARPPQCQRVLQGHLRTHLQDVVFFWIVWIIPFVFTFQVPLRMTTPASALYMVPLLWGRARRNPGRSRRPPSPAHGPREEPCHGEGPNADLGGLMGSDPRWTESISGGRLAPRGPPRVPGPGEWARGRGCALTDLLVLVLEMGR